MTSDDLRGTSQPHVGFELDPGVLSDEAERDFRVDPTMPAGKCLGEVKVLGIRSLLHPELLHAEVQKPGVWEFGTRLVTGLEGIPSYLRVSVGIV